MNNRVYLNQKKELKELFFTVAISLICHLLFFAGLILLPQLKPDKISLPSVIKVNMVTLPELTDKKPATLIKATPVKTEFKKKSLKKLSLKTGVNKILSTPVQESAKKPKLIKKSLKKKTYQASKVRKHAIEQIQKKVQESKEEQLAKTFDRLKSEVKKTETNISENKRPSPQQSGVTNEKQLVQLIDVYRNEVAYQVNENWGFSKQMAGDEYADLIVKIVFKVLPNGIIDDIFFTERSGNAYLDEVAKRTIIKSSPVHPHPQGINRPFVEIGLRFTSKGLE